MNKIIRFFKFYSPSILAGFLIGTSYIPFPPWASLFCFVPLWLFWNQLSVQESFYKRIWLSGWITQFTLTLIGFNWVALTAHEFGHFPWPLSIITLLAFCAVANLYIPIVGLLWAFINRKLSLRGFESFCLMATLTALFENLVPTLFPWNFGYTLFWAKLPIAQISEIVGFQGLSSIVILFNLGFLYFWKLKSKKALFFTSLFFLLLNIAGQVLKQTLPVPDAQLSTLITQANIGNLEKVYAEKKWGYRDHIKEKYLGLTQLALKEDGFAPDLIVWPETAYPYELDQSLWSPADSDTMSVSIQVSTEYPASLKPLSELAQATNSNLVIGGYGVSPLDQKATNTFFIIEKDGLPQPTPYYKTILLAFGEFIPGADVFPILRKWIPAGNFSRGPGPQVKTVPLRDRMLKVGPQICYESLFPEFSRVLAAKGAEVIINLTNDSWYGTWQEPYQHLYMTLARAIEFRRPLIRSTNTGISTVVLASGEVLETSAMRAEWTGKYQIHYKTNPPSTIYQNYPWLIQALLIFIVFLIVMKRKIFGRTR